MASVAVRGELDIATAPHVEEALRDAQPGSPVVILDLQELDFIDSQGAQLTINADRRARETGGRLVIVRGPRASWFFELIGIDRSLEIVDRPQSQPQRSAAAAWNA